MATALTADAMLAALKKWGITPKFYKSDWRTHNRNAVQGFGPLYGFVIHCFGSDGSDANSLAYLYNGDLARGMPGPLSQFSITDDGQVWVIGWGTANHMGSLDPRLHDLVLKDAAPMTSDFKPNVNFGSTGAMHNVNDNYLGVEMTYGAAPTAAQRKSVARLAAALMDALGSGYTGGSVIGHREATTDRSDPTGVPMWQLRGEINALLKAGPAGTPTTAPTPTEEDDMFTDADRTLLKDTLNKADGSTIRNDLAWQNKQAALLAGQVSGLTAALQSIGSGQQIDLAGVEAAARAGASAALATLDATVTLKPSDPTA